jgi:hypothetical protein
MIRRQMPEDHDSSTCAICQFLAKPCANCGKIHATYEEAAHCMRKDATAYRQYSRAMTNRS